MGPTCPAWLPRLAGYCWALSPMGIFSLFLLKKMSQPHLFRWCFSILISWCRGWGIYTWVEFWWNDNHINIYLIYISIKLLARCSYQGDVAGAIYHAWRRIGKFDYPYFFCHTAAATSTLLVVEKARVSGEDHKTQSHWQLYHMHGKLGTQVVVRDSKLSVYNHTMRPHSVVLSAANMSAV